MGKKSSSKPKATKQEKALAKIAEKKFELYEELYRPLAKERLKEGRSTQARRDEAKALVHADASMAEKGQHGKIAAAGLAAGHRLSSDRVALAQSDQDIGFRKVRGHATANARRNVDRAERATEVAHIKLGHGLASQMGASMTDQARNATSAAIQSAQADMQKSSAFGTALGQFAGTAYGLGAFDNMNFGGTAARPQFGTYQLNGGRSMR